jgi:hypothetical protein
LASQARVSLSLEQKPQGVKTGIVPWSVDYYTLLQYQRVVVS